MARFSIIVPYIGDINLFDDTLASVLRYRPDDSQVIVAHDGSYENHHRLTNEVEFAVSSRKAQLIRLFNCGVRLASGAFVAFIRPGVELDESWHFSVQKAFLSDANIGSVSPMIVSPLKPNKLVAAGVARNFGYCRKLVGMNMSTAPRKTRSLSPLGPTSWAAFYRRSVLEVVGTCDELLDPVYFDLDLALTFSKLGFRCQLSSECVASIDRSTPLLREVTMAHGRSAQRAARRHAKNASLGSTLCAITGELIKSPLNPWMVQHAIQRFGASKMADIDRHFCEKISRALRQRKWEAANDSTIGKAA